MRLPVKKTYKLYVGGSFPRSESGRSYEAEGANVALASKKDLRDAVRAAREALESAGMTTPTRRLGQQVHEVVVGGKVGVGDVEGLPRPRDGQGEKPFGRRAAHRGRRAEESRHRDAAGVPFHGQASAQQVARRLRPGGHDAPIRRQVGIAFSCGIEIAGDLGPADEPVVGLDANEGPRPPAAVGMERSQPGDLHGRGDRRERNVRVPVLGLRLRDRRTVDGGAAVQCHRHVRLGRRSPGQRFLRCRGICPEPGVHGAGPRTTLVHQRLKHVDDASRVDPGAHEQIHRPPVRFELVVA